MDTIRKCVKQVNTSVWVLEVKGILKLAGDRLPCQGDREDCAQEIDILTKGLFDELYVLPFSVLYAVDINHLNDIKSVALEMVDVTKGIVDLYKCNINTDDEVLKHATMMFLRNNSQNHVASMLTNVYIDMSDEFNKLPEAVVPFFEYVRQGCTKIESSFRYRVTGTMDNG